MLLEVEDLSVEFGAGAHVLKAVDGVNFSIAEGEVVGIVGESGSGKSVTSLAVMGLIPYPGRVRARRLTFAGQDLLAMSESARRQLTGNDIAMIFQDPLTSLNPCYTVGYQIMETLKVHEGGSRKERQERTVELLAQVGIPDPRRRLDSYPHQLSGGMNQRVMIAMAIACNPRLLIADEPTTALDVTIQAQIMDLLLKLQEERRMALILITHDLAVVSETAHRVVVMYAGQVVETSGVPKIFEHPRHPYTQALLNALPERAVGKRRLPTIPGVVPGLLDRPKGCLLHPRCPYSEPLCAAEPPPLFPEDGNDARLARCFFALDSDGRPTNK